MYSRTLLGLKYLRYYLTASNGKGHGIHSPFIFHFINNVLNDKNYYLEFDLIEDTRRELLKDQTDLFVEDFGAGSSLSKTNKRTIASIARNAAKHKKYSRLLFRIVKEYKPNTILELGTSLGISTSYLAAGLPSANVITIEGASEAANIARINFKKLQLQN
ncbi:MAG: SAM-dependent methyltransferase, partial [Bacteroidia bacterium]|nr:SAM-dependent methyltransferase [Bacteroidia bacterium]